MAVEICGNLAISVGKPFSKHATNLIQPMAALLGDQKPLVRGAAIKALENVYLACGIDVFITPSAAALIADNPNLRKDLLKFLSEKLEGVKQAGDSLPKMEELLKPLFMCLQDRNSDVRKYGALVLPFIADDIGGSYVADRAGEWYNGSALASLKPYFEPLRDVSKASSGNTQAKELAIKKVIARPGSAASSVAPAPAAKKRPASVAQVPPTAKAAVPEVKSSSEPVLTSDSKLKDNRANQDRGMNKWMFETPRKELVDFLQSQCKDNLSEAVVLLLFSTAHFKEKDFLQGLTLIDESIVTANMKGDEEMKARFVANTDIILKYVTIRLFDTNTSMLIKVLELLEHLFSLLYDQGCSLSEYEASAFLPFFITKVGDSKETMRVKVRGIFKQIPKIYPPSKFFTYLVNALPSKNSRVRAECLEELGDLIKKNGMSVCITSKVLPVIASQISDSDAKVRNAALGTITNVYMLMGDTVYKQLGRISEKEKSLLDEKLKRLPPPIIQKEAVAEALPKSFEAKRQQTPSRESPDENSSVRSVGAAGLVGVPKATIAIKKEFSMDFDQINTPGQQIDSKSQNSGVSDNYNLMIDYLVTQITAGDAYQSIDALKQLEKIITGPIDHIIPHIDEIISAVTLQIRIAFSAADLSSVGTTRLCKHLVNVLVQIFSLSEISKHIQRVPLHQCVQELLNRLLDPNLQTVEQGPQLAKALNVLMVRVLDNTDRNLSFGILLALLEQSASAAIHCSAEEIPLQAKYTELVMKCLWKLTKVIPQLVQEKSLDPGQLIVGVHEFLKLSPPNEWKRRAAEKIVPQADMPLRTVKTILHELCNCLGVGILEYINLVEDPGRSHAIGYIRQMLAQQNGGVPVNIPNLDIQSQKASSPVSISDSDQKLMTIRRAATAQASRESIYSPVPALMHPSHGSSSVQFTRRASTGPLSEVEADAQLTLIFAKISAKEETKQGIADLYRFRKLHPDCEVYVNQHLGKTGNYFQGYIKRGLAALENEEKNAFEIIARPASAEYIARPASSLRQSSVSSVASNESSSTAPSDAYRDTLVKFQQRLSMIDSSNADELTTITTAAAPVASALPVRFSMPVSGFSGDNSNGTLKFSPPSPKIFNRTSVPTVLEQPEENRTPAQSASRTQTVEQLKARLAAMKMQQLSSSNNDIGGL
ncbi:Cytoskeleton associated protein 5 [Physocladia obscura]|uniref:Cytoskeleton associated protein 5 n=1 Tax=Physocladia obscura TaxID=109957 RepID=A0AAD5SV65_9FUNG|nr:Cytoskeleton associated protein 5 [Physocladia obscura]